MKIFIDFDDVLFNTKKFREDLQNLFFQHGISREVFEKNYFSSGKIKTYDPWEHIETISKEEKINKNEILKELEEFMIDTNPYLFEDSVDFLKSFDEQFVCIVSYGDSKFQGMKIGECRVGKYCKEIKITNQLKSDVIEEEIKKWDGKEKIFFIEDRTEQIEDVKRIFPFIETIFMRRSEGRYADEKTSLCDYEARNLQEVEELIKSLK